MHLTKSQSNYGYDCWKVDFHICLIWTVKLPGPAMTEISFPPLTDSITEICFVCLTESKLHRYRRSSEDLWSLWKRLMWVREHQSLGYIKNTNAVSHCLKTIANFDCWIFLENIFYITSGIQFTVQLQYTTLWRMLCSCFKIRSIMQLII